MIIEVMAWGDFDIPYTKWIGENPDCNMGKQALVLEFLDSEDITEFRLSIYGASRISDVHELPDKFINFLRLKGFKKVETVRISFSD